MQSKIESEITAATVTHERDGKKYINKRALEMSCSVSTHTHTHMECQIRVFRNELVYSESRAILCVRPLFDRCTLDRL